MNSILREAAPELYESDGRWYLYIAGTKDGLGQHYDSSNFKLPVQFNEAIEALIQRKQLEARIDEVENKVDDYFYNPTDAGGRENRRLRIRHLKAELKALREKE